MKAGLLFFVHAVFISESVATLQSSLYVSSEKSPSESAMIRRFLIDFLNVFKSEKRKDFAFIIEGLNANGLKVNASSGPWPNMSYLNLFEGRVFFGGAKAEEFLKNIKWNRRTLFVVFLPRNPTDDKFYLDDFRHQNLEMDVVVKEETILKKFRGYVLEEGKRRLEAGEEIKATLKNFWTKRILNVIVAKPQKTRMYIYTYFPYTRMTCAEHLVPVLTNVWFRASSTFYRNHPFFPEKMGNMFGCRLNVTVVLNPPAIIPDGSGLNGIEGKILMELFSVMNATPNFFFVNPSNKSATAMNYVLKDVMNGESDIGAGFLVPTKAETGKTDCIYVSVNLCLTWAVPNRAKIKNLIAYIFDTFAVRVWVGIIMSVTVSVVFFSILVRATVPQTKVSIKKTSFRIISTFMGEPGAAPREMPLRLFLFFFILFSVLISEIFQAGLGSNNIIVQPRSQLDSIEDVIDSGLEIKGVDHAVELFDRLQISKEARVDFGDIHDSLFEVGKERRTIYIGFKLPMKYYKNILHPELRNLIHIHRSCLVTYQPFFALRKNSPFSDRVNTLVTAMAENGYSNFLYENFTKFEKRDRRKNKREEVDMILFYGSLQIWAYGMFISFLTFLAECGCAKYKNKLTKLIGKK